MADDIPKYPLYDSTYTAYRLSPLYHGANTLLDETTLRMHAHRLRDILRGDILRGIDVGAGNQDGSSGTLESCTWDLIGDEEAWQRLHRPDTQEQDNEQPGDLSDAPSLDPADARGVHVELRYQKAIYTALLLRDPSSTVDETPAGFTALPLLLVRMPAALRATFSSYVASAFDAHVAPLKLRSRFLSATLESILAHLDAPQSLLARLQLQLAFPTACPTAALRHLDITLARADIPAFLQRGTSLLLLLRRQNPPTATTNTNNITGPFTAALAHYLSTHLALNALAHPAVRVAKIALPPLLALSAGADDAAAAARVKVFDPQHAANADVGIAELRRVGDAFYTALLLEAARAAPVGEGVGTIGVGGAGEEEAVLVLRKGKGKEKEKERQVVEMEKGTKGKGKGKAADGSNGKKGKKRALAEGDANVVAGGGGGRGKKAEPSPGSKRRKGGRRGGAADAGDEVDGGAEEEEGREEEDAIGGSSAARSRREGDGGARAACGGSEAGGGVRLSVPQEPPPPYELHDPAIVR